MEMITYTGDLQRLRHHLQACIQACINDDPVHIQCTIRERNLVVLGQHRGDAVLDPAQILHMMERRIQTLQLQFTQSVRLYLRIIGQKQPYAHRQFAIQPPPPSIQHIPRRWNPSTEGYEELWIEDDDDLERLIEQLTSFDSSYSRTNMQSPASSPSGHPTNESQSSSSPVVLTLSDESNLFKRFQENWQRWFQPFVSQRAIDGSLGESVDIDSSSALVVAHDSSPSHQLSRLGHLDTQIAIALGITTLGAMGGTYGLTRYCLIGSCPELQTAQALQDDIKLTLNQAETWDDLDTAYQSIERGIALLDPIPVWSKHAHDAHPLLDDYQTQAKQIDQLLALERVVREAQEASQRPIYDIEVWKELQSLWQSTLAPLQAIPSDSDLYPFAQQLLQTHRQQLAEIERQIRLEEDASRTLERAKRSARRAQMSRYRAETPQDWQHVQETWAIALEQLRQIPQGTIAAIDARRLVLFYESSLEEVTTVQAGDDTLPRVAVGSSTHPEIRRLETELGKVCLGESSFCRLISASPTIRIELNADYVDAVIAARSARNNDLEAIATHHRKLLGQGFEHIANTFNRPLEVYTPDQELLERHQPSSQGI
ncbi:MAG: hypothetical protein ACFE0J_01350 [Elainellaceae cyanobacterium]